VPVIISRIIESKKKFYFEKEKEKKEKII